MSKKALQKGFGRSCRRLCNRICCEILFYSMIQHKIIQHSVLYILYSQERSDALSCNGSTAYRSFQSRDELRDLSSNNLHMRIYETHIHKLTCLYTYAMYKDRYKLKYVHM